MIVKNLSEEKKIVNKVLSTGIKTTPDGFLPTIKRAMKKREAILKLTSKNQTPFYVFDKAEADRSIGEFKKAFKKHIPDCEIYYAVKTSDHELLLKSVLRHGLGLDVSSGRELDLAIKHGVKRMVFSGPAKSREELKKAIKNRNKLIIHLDSFQELKNLGEFLRGNESIVAGVRITTSLHGKWNKFGIPIEDLARFWREAKKYPGIKLSGIQCHMSFNKSSAPYEGMIKEIGAYLAKNFTKSELKEIKFFDFGGGFASSLVEGEYPWITHQGRIVQAASEYLGREPKYSAKYYPTKSDSPDAFAKGIASALKKYFEPIVDCRYMCEPGQIIANDSLHIVLRLADLKSKKFGIADGGINLIGVWEKYEDYYAPVINLTHPSLKEIKFTLYGNLCTPYDIWGYYCYAKKMMVGDVLFIPFQGAYTYTLASDFIKPIAETHSM